MTEKPRTFDIKFDSAGDFDKARELIERMNAALAAKEAQINRVRALAIDNEKHSVYESDRWKELLAALGEPAATPERNHDNAIDERAD